MIADKRAKFDIPRGVTYLNCAYLSPLLRGGQNRLKHILRSHGWCGVYASVDV
jgi:hypothetical protein